MRSRFLAVVLLLCCAVSAQAQLAPNTNHEAAGTPAPTAGSRAVTVDLTQQKVIKGVGGVERLVTATTVKPGDVIEYRAIYTNTGKDAIGQLAAKLPIPDGLEYVANSAKPGGRSVKAATKDGQFANEPLVRKLANGKTEAVPYNEYRTLQWNIEQLKGGTAIVVSARAKVEAVLPKVPAQAAASATTTQAAPTTKP